MDSLTKFKNSLYSMYELFNSNKTHITGMTNGITGLRVTVVVSSEEPHALEDLPLNVLWLYTNKSSLKFKTLYRRISKQLDPNGKFEHTWEELLDYDLVWEKQKFADPVSVSFNNATETSLGLVKLSYPSSDPSKLVGDDDPRLTDSRVPLYHTHDEIPATMLKTNESQLDLNDQTDESGVLTSKDGKTFSYTKIPFSVVEGKPNDT